MARAYNQAQKFGAEIAIPEEARLLEGVVYDGARFKVKLGNDETIMARSVILASGARYRRLDIPNLSDFEGTCVHYWASAIETKLCGGKEVRLTGAGNSAGQAVVFLADKVKKLWMVVRGARLEATMSQYLIDRIRALPMLKCCCAPKSQVLKAREASLRQVRWKNRDSGRESQHDIGHVFSFIGAEPNTDWLTGCGIALDDKGFVITGAVGSHMLATTRDGIFAVGDVRCGSVKRVAAAVGEGSIVVSAVHAYLANRRAAENQKSAAA